MKIEVTRNANLFVFIGCLLLLLIGVVLIENRVATNRMFDRDTILRLLEQRDGFLSRIEELQNNFDELAETSFGEYKKTHPSRDYIAELEAKNAELQRQVDVLSTQRFEIMRQRDDAIAGRN